MEVWHTGGRGGPKKQAGSPDSKLHFSLHLPTPPPPRRKRDCETVKLTTPQTSTKSSGYAHRGETSQKHRNCETVSVLELMSNHHLTDSTFTVSQRHFLIFFFARIVAFRSHLPRNQLNGKLIAES